jgi:effector-binding domain-containing protein
MYDITECVLIEQPTAVIRHRLEVTGIEAWIGPAFARVTQAVAAAGLWVAGAPFARFHRVEGTAAEFDVEAGFPVSAPFPATAADDVQPSRLPGGPAVTTLHQGPYEAMTPAYEAVEKWLADNGVSPDGAGWESYLSEPWGDPSTWRTEVIQPYRVP